MLPDHTACRDSHGRRNGGLSTLVAEHQKGFTRRTSQSGYPSTWQSRYREHAVRDEAGLQSCVDDVAINPLNPLGQSGGGLAAFHL
jgi:hypothetical protein